MSDRKVRGLLADANLAGHFHYLVRLLEKLDLASVLDELSLDFLTIGDLRLPGNIDDRSLWSFCQRAASMFRGPNSATVPAAF